MSKAPRLLDVQVAVHGVAWEWQLLDQQDLIMSGLETSRDDAQREGDSALFEWLLAGRAKPLYRDQK